MRIESKQVLERGLFLSQQLKHHLFDALYHAVAIEHGAMLITSDDAYFARALRLGNIKLLVNLSFPVN
jgi:predicted nucleic acid-binding protein